MLRKIYFSSYVLLSIAIFCSAQISKFNIPENDRIKTNIDFNWQFINRDFAAEEETHQVNQLPWQKVNLPHDWTIEGPYSEEHNTTQGFLPMGIGWYKKGLHFPESYAGKKIFIILGFQLFLLIRFIKFHDF